MSESRDADILIVGAGLSGLMAAKTLIANGVCKTKSVLIVDKGRSVGGRLATRRIGAGRADHGAQFMTVRELAFQRHVDEWLAAGVAYKWSDGWGPNFDGYPRYAIQNGFNALAKHLAADIMDSATNNTSGTNVSIQTNVRLTDVRQADIPLASNSTSAGWQIHDEAGNVYRATTVVLTSPVPQSLALLDAGGVTVGDAYRAALDKLLYAPCLCGLFWLDGETTFEEPGVALNPDAVVSWMADNQRKGISPDERLVTVHAGPSYSTKNYEAPDHEIEPILRNSLQPFLTPDTQIREAQVKRWRYAQPLDFYPERFMHALSSPHLYFGGDIFGGPRVEGAALSGIAIADAILAQMESE